LGRCFGFLDVIIIGMEPSVIDWSASLSEEVRKALPLMIRAAKAELYRPELGALVEPRTIEAFILAAADDLDAKIHQVRQALAEDDSDAEFTGYHVRLKRSFLKPARER
jgi:GDP-D-mannose dehydratase